MRGRQTKDHRAEQHQSLWRDNERLKALGAFFGGVGVLGATLVAAVTKLIDLL